MKSRKIDVFLNCSKTAQNFVLLYFDLLQIYQTHTSFAIKILKSEKNPIQNFHFYFEINKKSLFLEKYKKCIDIFFYVLLNLFETTKRHL